jgi:hypothetical protein
VGSAESSLIMALFCLTAMISDIEKLRVFIEYAWVFYTKAAASQDSEAADSEALSQQGPSCYRDGPGFNGDRRGGGPGPVHGTKQANSLRNESDHLDSPALLMP